MLVASKQKHLPNTSLNGYLSASVVLGRVLRGLDTKGVVFRQSVIMNIVFNVLLYGHLQRLGPRDGPSYVTLARSCTCIPDTTIKSRVRILQSSISLPKRHECNHHSLTHSGTVALAPEPPCPPRGSVLPTRREQRSTPFT